MKLVIDKEKLEKEELNMKYLTSVERFVKDLEDDILRKELKNRPRIERVSFHDWDALDDHLYRGLRVVELIEKPKDFPINNFSINEIVIFTDRNSSYYRYDSGTNVNFMTSKNSNDFESVSKMLKERNKMGYFRFTKNTGYHCYDCPVFFIRDVCYAMSFSQHYELLKDVVDFGLDHYETKEEYDEAYHYGKMLTYMNHIFKTLYGGI